MPSEKRRVSNPEVSGPTGNASITIWPQGGYVGVICAYSASTGEELTVRSSKYSTPPMEIGDPVEVIYRSDNPKRSMLAFEVKSRVGFDVALPSVMGALWAGADAGLFLTV